MARPVLGRILGRELGDPQRSRCTSRSRSRLARHRDLYGFILIYVDLSRFSMDLYGCILIHMDLNCLHGFKLIYIHLYGFALIYMHFSLFICIFSCVNELGVARKRAASIFYPANKKHSRNSGLCQFWKLSEFWYLWISGPV